jgi:hypothetical protein
MVYKKSRLILGIFDLRVREFHTMGDRRKVLNLTLDEYL